MFKDFYSSCRSNGGFTYINNFYFKKQKRVKKTILKLALLGILFTAVPACNTANNEDKTEQTGAEYTSAYVCPMHCKGSGSDTTGLCPVCGMDLVENSDKK